MNPRESKLPYDKKAEEIRVLARENLRFLACEILGIDVWSQFHNEVAEFLKRPGKKKLILLPRDHLKSTIVTKAWSIQQALNNFDVRILLANSIWDNARKFLRSIQKHLRDGSTLAHVFGRFTSPNWNQDECTIRQRKKILDAATWTTTGIEREQTSQHYDLIIADDLHGRENVMTKEQREKVKTFYKDTMSLLDPAGTIIVIGTRWSIDDLYGDLLARPTWDCLVKTCWKENGQPLFPERYTKEKLLELRAEKGSLEFSGQYLNSPIDEEHAVFKKSQITYYYNFEDVPPVFKILTVDPSLTQKAGSDYTALMVTGMDANGNIWVLDYIREKFLPQDIISAIFKLIDRWKLTRVGIESYSVALTLNHSIRDEMKRRMKFFSLIEMRKPKSIADKEMFIQRLQPPFELGMIKIKKTMTELEDEMLAFPRGRHDDLLDCLAYAMDYLIKPTNAQPLEAPREFTLRWWLENKMPERDSGGLYHKFLKDLENPVHDAN